MNIENRWSDQFKNRQTSYSPVDYNLHFELPSLEGFELGWIPVGNLQVPSGRIIACDPLALVDHGEGYARTVDPGRYPVKVRTARNKQSETRYALAVLEFSARKAERWEMARKEKDLKILVKEGNYLGFPVASGLGSFMDHETFGAYKRFYDDFLRTHPGGDIYDDLFVAEFEKNALDSSGRPAAGDWLNFKVPEGNGANVAMFRCGQGNGIYPSYWGIAEDGSVTSLVVDFLVLDGSKA